jgi:2'-5' RNA ligase
VSGADTPQRLFFAVWPTPSLQERLQAVADDALPPAQRGRRTPVRNVHLTLVFIGDADMDLRARLEQSASRIRVPAFELVIDQVGCFRRHGIVWAGPSRLPDGLRDLVAALVHAQSECGLTPESRAYAAHITLARHVRRCPREREISPVSWPVREFALVCSRAGAYEVLAAWPLVG